MIHPALIQAVSSVLKVPSGEISLATSQKNTSTWDSLAHLNLMLQIEANCGVRFMSNEIPLLTSVAVIQEALDRHGAR